MLKLVNQFDSNNSKVNVATPTCGCCCCCCCCVATSVISGVITNLNMETDSKSKFLNLIRRILPFFAVPITLLVTFFIIQYFDDKILNSLGLFSIIIIGVSSAFIYFAYQYIILLGVMRRHSLKWLIWMSVLMPIVAIIEVFLWATFIFGEGTIFSFI